MAELTLESLAARVAELEPKLASPDEPKKDWRQAVGMFDDDPEFMNIVIAETLAIREREREAARAGEDEVVEPNDCHIRYDRHSFDTD